MKTRRVARGLAAILKNAADVAARERALAALADFWSAEAARHAAGASDRHLRKHRTSRWLESGAVAGGGSLLDKLWSEWDGAPTSAPGDNGHRRRVPAIVLWHGRRT